MPMAVLGAGGGGSMGARGAELGGAGSVDDGGADAMGMFVTRSGADEGGGPCAVLV